MPLGIPGSRSRRANAAFTCASSAAARANPPAAPESTPPPELPRLVRRPLGQVRKLRRHVKSIDRRRLIGRLQRQPHHRFAIHRGRRHRARAPAPPPQVQPIHAELPHHFFNRRQRRRRIPRPRRVHVCPPTPRTAPPHRPSYPALHQQHPPPAPADPPPPSWQIPWQNLVDHRLRLFCSTASGTRSVPMLATPLRGVLALCARCCRQVATYATNQDDAHSILGLPMMRRMLMGYQRICESPTRQK